MIFHVWVVIVQNILNPTLQGLLHVHLVYTPLRQEFRQISGTELFRGLRDTPAERARRLVRVLVQRTGSVCAGIVVTSASDPRCVMVVPHQNELKKCNNGPETSFPKPTGAWAVSGPYWLRLHA